MQFRQTAFDPQGQVNNRMNDPSVDFAGMDKQLAEQMARMKVDTEKRKREITKICHESDELKELQQKIRLAYLNKERSAQITEGQFRKQDNLEKDAAIDIEYLRRKEHADLKARSAAYDKTCQLYDLKANVQGQMIEREQLREAAFAEYARERENVDAIVQKMINEDHEMMRINTMKQNQSKQDMVLSVNEKKALLLRQRQLEEYEEELVRKYGAQQQGRADELQAMKEMAEAQRDAIFQKLAAEEKQRREASESLEKMRNDLHVEEQEEKARQQERDEHHKRLRQKNELQNAKDYQLKLKAERLQEEKRMEDEFKIKMAEKFAEDERLEQMNAQKRRMRELQHKRDIEDLWQQKLAVYRAQREEEWAEKHQVEEQESFKQDIIAQEKERLLMEHRNILEQFNPKAHSAYASGFQQ